MASNPFPKPAPSFDDPLAMLRACHERILAQCATLRQLVEHIKKTGADQAACDAAAQILRYFSTAGRHHHEDEEQDLFPLLRQAGGGNSELIGKLEEDHKAMERTWAELEELLQNRLASLPTHASLVTAFASLYTRHIALENDNLLPHAQRALTKDQLSTLGTSMARRRGVKT